MIKDDFISGSEPYSNISIKEIEEKLSSNLTQEELAELYAICSNKFFWLEEEYDYKVESKEYNEILDKSSKWESAYVIIQERIFKVLREQGIKIPKKRQITVLEPFMKQYGYIDSNGWWIKEK